MCNPLFSYRLQKTLSRGFKFYLTACTKLRKGVGEETLHDVQYFQSSPSTVLEETEIVISSHISEIELKVDNFLRNGSGWVIEGVREITISISPFEPFYTSGGSYIPLPSALKRKKGLINIKNEDNM